MHPSHGATPAGGTKQQVELSFSATGLKNKDIKTKSDPILYVYTAKGAHGGKTKWEVYGKTEVLMDNLNPKWTKTVAVPYAPAQPLLLKFKVFDGDKHAKVKLGTVKNVDLQSLMTAPAATINRALILKNHQHGNLLVSASLKDESEGHLEFNVRAQHLKKMDRGSKSDGFLKISRQQGTSWVLVHQTEVVEDSLDPHWKPFKIPLSKLHSADGNLLVECFDEDKGTRGRSEQYIGEFTVPLEELKTRPEVIRELHQVKTHKKDTAGEVTLRCKLHGGHAGAAAHGGHAAPAHGAAGSAPHGGPIPSGVPQAGYPPQGYPPQGYPPQGYPPQGYPPQGYPPQGYPPQGYPPQGYPPQGFPQHGYPPQGFPPQGAGHPPAGFPPQGYPPQGYPPQGYPPQGFPPQANPMPGYPQHGNPQQGHGQHPPAGHH